MKFGQRLHIKALLINKTWAWSFLYIAVTQISTHWEISLIPQYWCYLITPKLFIQLIRGFFFFFFFASCFLWSQWCHSKKIDSVMSGSSRSLKTGGWGWWGNKSETVLTIRILTFSGAFQSKLLPRSHKKTTLGTFPLPFFQSFVERRGGGGNAPFPSPQFHSD